MANANFRVDAEGAEARIRRAFKRIEDWIRRHPDGVSGSPLTNKGDIYTYSTSDDRLSVGNDGDVLVSESTEATGLKWVAPSSIGGGNPQQLYFSADQGGSEFISTPPGGVDVTLSSVDTTAAEPSGGWQPKSLIRCWLAFYVAYAGLDPTPADATVGVPRVHIRIGATSLGFVTTPDNDPLAPGKWYSLKSEAVIGGIKWSEWRNRDNFGLNDVNFSAISDDNYFPTAAGDITVQYDSDGSGGTGSSVTITIVHFVVEYLPPPV